MRESLNFSKATELDLNEVIRWVPDAESCLVWAGPRVRFPLVLTQLAEDIEFDIVRTYGFRRDNRTIALGQIRIFEHDRAHLSRIIVNPDERGKGIGRLFVEKLISEAKGLKCWKISLHVIIENHVARRLYTSLGFMIPTQPDNLREGIIYMELER